MISYIISFQDIRRGGNLGRDGLIRGAANNWRDICDYLARLRNSYLQFKC